MIKKITSVILLCIFLFNILGYYFVFRMDQSIQKSKSQNIIHQGLARSLIIVIKIDKDCSNPNFKKLDKNEFYYYGQLFDVITKSIKGNTTWYYCYHDIQEENLNTGFEKIKSLSSGTDNPGHLIHLMGLMYNHITLALLSEISHPVTHEKTEISFCHYFFHVVSDNEDPVFPPPESFSLL